MCGRKKDNADRTQAVTTFSITCSQPGLLLYSIVVGTVLQFKIDLSFCANLCANV